MKRVFLFVHWVENRCMFFDIQPLIPNVLATSAADMVRFSNAMMLIKQFDSKKLYTQEKSRDTDTMRYDVAKAACEVLCSEFPGDEIEMIDQATCDKRIASGQYVEDTDRKVVYHA